MTEFRIELLGAGGSAPVRMTVPREEFYAAITHFKNKRTAGLFKAQEGTHRRLQASFLNITLDKYVEEMFKGGRWRDLPKGLDSNRRDGLDASNLHIFKGD